MAGDHQYCPGAKLIRQPAPETFVCTSCGAEVEIWTDELRANCPSCGHTVYRDSAMSCLDWCKYGMECVGNTVYSRYMRDKAVGMKQKLLEKLEEHFGEDRRRIEHAKKVLSFAEELLKEEEADWHIVVPASILHDTGIKLTEQKYGSAEGCLQEKEGPAVARPILLRLGLKLEDIEQICDIIAHHHSPGAIDTQNFKILYDADCLVNLKEEAEGKTDEQLAALIEKTFLTAAGKKRAREIYVKKPASIP